MSSQAFNLQHLEAEAGGSLWVQWQSGLQSEFKESQSCYKEILSQKNQKRKKRERQSQINNLHK